MRACLSPNLELRAVAALSPTFLALSGGQVKSEIGIGREPRMRGKAMLRSILQCRKSIAVPALHKLLGIAAALRISFESLAGRAIVTGSLRKRRIRGGC
jgi:hypothetical protein